LQNGAFDERAKLHGDKEAHRGLETQDLQTKELIKYKAFRIEPRRKVIRGKRRHGNRMNIKKFFLIALGFILVGLGTVGVIIPVLPTTPFILLAAFCFSASSKKFYTWLQRNRVFGQYIENYRTKQGISIRLKIASIAFLWTGLVVSMLITQAIWLYIILGIVGVCVTIHLLLIKTKNR